MWLVDWLNGSPFFPFELQGATTAMYVGLLNEAKSISFEEASVAPALPTAGMIPAPSP
jgi:hypothetical protein